MSKTSQSMPLTLAMKLGSIVIHTDEWLSADGHPFDETVLRGLLADPEVVSWVESMGGLLPVKRRSK